VGSGAIATIVICLVVVVVFAGLGVYYYDAYHKLTFELKNVAVENISLTSVQTSFDFQIGNPNVLPIYIPDGSFEIYVNDQYLGAGTFGAVTVNGNSQSQITVPVAFNTTDASSVLFGIITGGGSVTVTAKGQANLVLFSLPFETTLYNTTLG
jgi:LEA14-like dessication related protein